LVTASLTESASSYLPPTPNPDFGLYITTPARQLQTKCALAAAAMFAAILSAGTMPGRVVANQRPRNGLQQRAVAHAGA
jgi:uncharacterized membrane protein